MVRVLLLLTRLVVVVPLSHSFLSLPRVASGAAVLGQSAVVPLRQTRGATSSGATPPTQTQLVVAPTAIPQITTPTDKQARGGSMQMRLDARDTDREVVLASVKQHGIALYGACAALKADREVVMAAVKQDGRALYDASAELKADRKVVLAAVQQDGHALYSACSKLKADFKVVMAAVKQDGRALEYASADLKADSEVVLAAVQQDAKALNYMLLGTRDLEREIVLAAVQKDGHALKYCSAEMQADREVVIAAVHQNYHVLERASAKLKADRQVVLAAVQENGHALKYCSAEMQADREVVIAAVHQNYHVLGSLGRASAKLKADRQVMLAAVQKNGHALKYASAELQADREVVIAAVHQNYHVLERASAKLKADRQVVLAAVRQDPRALEYASAELLEDDPSDATLKASDHLFAHLNGLSDHGQLKVLRTQASVRECGFQMDNCLADYDIFTCGRQVLVRLDGQDGAPLAVGSFNYEEFTYGDGEDGEWGEWGEIRFANNQDAGGNRACGRSYPPPANADDILDQFDAFLPAMQAFETELNQARGKVRLPAPRCD
eukprot:scaffold65433_cov66-Phaeocystis_antarctica.AAC.15